LNVETSANIRTRGRREGSGEREGMLVLRILSFFGVFGGIIKSEKGIGELDYKQTNKSTGTTSTAGWQREDATHDKRTRNRRVGKTLERCLWR
jgi:hypothetical protein